MHGRVLFNAICTRSTAASSGKSSSPSMPETAVGCQMRADLIADSGYVHILLGIKGTIRHSANAFLHVSSNLIYMELLEASCGSAAVHFMRLCATATAYMCLRCCATMLACKSTVNCTVVTARSILSRCNAIHNNACGELCVCAATICIQL